MENEKQLLSLGLHKLLGAALGLSVEDMEKLLDPSYDVELKLVKRRSKEGIDMRPSSGLESAIDALARVESRQEAYDFLMRSFETRRTLEMLARFLDVPVVKQDKIESIRDKVIEATVGARLRSEAIKGKA